MTSLPAWPISARIAPSAATIEGPATRRPAHIPALDGIRGLAVLMVLVFHIFQVEPAPQRAIWRLGYAAAMLGQTGVDLFFVLSGFLITGILHDARGSRRYWVNFYGRRALRIFPLYYGFAALILVVVPRVLGVPATGLSWISLGTFTANFAMASGSPGGLLGHYWSLAIEEQFYLVWPMAVLLLGRVALMRVCLASMAVSALLRWAVESHGISSFTLTPCRIDTLLVGALLALAARGPGGLGTWSRRAVWVVPAALAAALPLYVTLRSGGSVALQVVKYPLLAVLYGGLLVVGVTASPGSRIARGLTARPLTILGKYSYGIYIYHPAMIHVVAWSFATASVESVFAALHPAAGLIVRIAMIGAGTAAAVWLSWHVLERPCLSLKRYFEHEAVGPAHGRAGGDLHETRADVDLYKSPGGRDDRGFPLRPTSAIERAAIVER